MLEIGAGLGSLTLALVETGAAVTAIEVDRHLIGPLRRGRRAPRRDGAPRRRAQRRLRRTSKGAPTRRRGEPALQRRDAPGAAPARDGAVGDADARHGPARGRRAPGGVAPATRPTARCRCACSYFADARVVGRVSPTVFLPRPRVESALVEIVRLATRARRPGGRQPRRRSSRSCARRSRHRRKMLRRSLAEWASEGVFERAGVDRDSPARGADDRGVRATGGGAMIDLVAHAKLTWILEITGRARRATTSCAAR